MAALETPQSAIRRKHACTVCARRKVKCNKLEPCNNCAKAQVSCTYEAPAAPRPRKRAADEDLHARLALYEDLMRKNDIEFSPYGHTWFLPGLEARANSNHVKSSTAEPVLMPFHAMSGTVPGEDSLSRPERCLWSTLSSDLKFPTVQMLFNEYHVSELPETPLHQLATGTQTRLEELHPEPRLVYRFWEIFVESINPLLRIVHVPSLQKRVLDASWHPGRAPKPLTAVLFAIYSLAVKATSPQDCQASFGEPRDVLLKRYKSACFRALIDADFLTSRDFEVLQAFVLFLFIEPDSELTSSLTGAAVRAGQKMSLHRITDDTKIPVFEKEIRIRLWWQLNGIDSRIRLIRNPGARKTPLKSEFGDCRLPLNVNDANLHPDMTELPQEHKGPTDMVAVLIKFEIFNWYRSCPLPAKSLAAMAEGPSRVATLELIEKTLADIESVYEEKFFRFLDHSIPLHRFSHAMGKLSIARMRFKVYHPRRHSTSGDGELYLSKEENSILFNSAVKWLEMVGVCFQTGFAAHLIAHLTTMFTVDAYIYMISELRRRTSGPQVTLAWKLVEDLYRNHPRIMDETENKLFAALGELTLEAWEARRDALVSSQGVEAGDITPPSIQALWNKRRVGDHLIVQSYMPDGTGIDDLGLHVNAAFDWEPWNDFLRP